MPDYKLFSDQQLTELLQVSDHAAFKEIYDRYWSVLYVYARKLTPDAASAEDGVQEVLAYIWEKRAQLVIHKTLIAYLYSSIRHSAIGLIRRSKVQDKYYNSFNTFLEQGECFTDQYILEKELRIRIERSIAAMPKRMREIFKLSRFETLSHKQIAEKLGLSAHTVDAQISNALRILKKQTLER